jgi:hypothetical protein
VSENDSMELIKSIDFNRFSDEEYDEINEFAYITSVYLDFIFNKIIDSIYKKYTTLNDFLDSYEYIDFDYYLNSFANGSDYNLLRYNIYKKLQSF